MKLLSKYYFILLLFSFIFGLYWYTKPPTILWIDSGTMIAGAYSLGIPNPPGFPSYMMIGYLFSHLPFLSPLAGMQMLTIVCSIGILLLIYKTISLILETDYFRFKEKIASSTIQKSAVFGTLLLAFSYQFWSQSHNSDAFILSYFFVTIFMYLLLRLPTVSARKDVFKTFAIIAFLYGIAAGANPTSAVFVPVVLYTMFLNRKNLKEIEVIVLGLIFFLTLIAVYSYLPLRARTYPFVNWGNPQTPEKIWAHLTGKGLDINRPDLGFVNGFVGSPSIFIHQFVHFTLLLLIQFTPFLLPIPLYGLKALKNKNTKLFLFFLIPVIAIIIYAGLYVSGNRESWYIPAWIMLSVAGGIGFSEISKNLLTKISFTKLFPLVVFLPFVTFFPILNRSSHYYTEDYGINLYTPLEKDAILIGISDFFNSLSNYYRATGKYRSDVIPIVANSFYAQSTYREAMREATHLSISTDIENIIQLKSNDEYNKALNQFIDENIDKHPIYLTHTTQRFSTVVGSRLGMFILDENKFSSIPNGLTFKVVRKGNETTPKEEAFNFVFRSSLSKAPFYIEENYRNGYERLLLPEYVYAYEALADWYQKRNEFDTANKWLAKAREIDESDFEVWARFGELNMSRKNFDLAEKYLTKALVIDPTNPATNYNLGITYLSLNDKTASKRYFNLAQQFSFPDDPVIEQSQAQLRKIRVDEVREKYDDEFPDWQIITSKQFRLSIFIPNDFSTSASEGTTMLITNNKTGSLKLEVVIELNTFPKNEGFDKYVDNKSAPLNETIISSQKTKVSDFSAFIQILTTKSGSFYPRYIITDNRYIWLITAKPGNSPIIDTFYQILKTFEPI